MTDFFALFDEPRQPWLDANAIKEKYHQLARAAHPDAGQRAAHLNFEEINEAYRVLSDPKLRIQHLLALEGERRAMVDQSVPEDLQQRFLQIGALWQKVKRRGERADLGTEIEQSLGDLTHLYDRCLAELEELNETWDENRSLALLQLQTLQDRMSYLSRWLDQLKEIQFEFTAAANE